MKRIIACLMAGVMLLALVGCGASGSSGSASSAAKKDYTQILHDARSDEDNKYEMIFTKGEDGKFTAQYGYSAEYEADQLSDEVANMMMPLLGLEDDMYDDFAASVSGMMVSVYGVAIVKARRGQDAGRGGCDGCLCPEPAEVHGALPRRPVPDRFCRPRGDCPHRRGGHGLL